MQARADEVRGIAADVEQGVRSVADDCVEALRAVESRRLLQLQSQADGLGRALQAVQRCAEAAAAACVGDDAPLDFLRRFRQLSDTCERLTAKPVSEDIEARRARGIPVRNKR